MVTDPENERLYTADSLGMVYVWDLSGCDWRNPDLIVPTATPSKAKAAGSRGSFYGRRAPGARDGEVKRLFGWQAHTSVRGPVSLSPSLINPLLSHVTAMRQIPAAPLRVARI
jgi:hypothetical protein